MKRAIPTKVSLLCLVIPLLALFTACSERAGRIASRSANEFRSLLNNEKYAEIYTQADVELHHSISETDFTAKLRAIHGRLGRAKSEGFTIRGLDKGILGGWQLGMRRPEEKATIETLTPYEHGSELEEFTWMIREGRAKLVSYAHKGTMISIKTPPSK